ncbi:nucleotidyltransferase domain-containing protein [Exiguobacterium sp.]|uniref:nucleotidyltransferase domain-containing protein n=1 Tax=Exiguobacterium sp. TaxID=44751 RepID=UPI0028A0D0EA|nr:nucleotidyltransferase domain-containing protein [Exiguobacterium sp.]
MQYPTTFGMKNGYIHNPTSAEAIPVRYRTVIRDVVAYVQTLSAFHGVYLYGSVAKGTARPFESDLDFTLILTEPLTVEEHMQLDERTEHWLTNYPFVTKIDYDIGLLGDVIRDDEALRWGVWLKSVNLFLAGENLQSRFPSLRPTRALGFALNSEVCEQLKTDLFLLETGQITLLDSDSIVKRIVRSAYHLILEEDQSFVHDLETLRPILFHYFPDEPRFLSLFTAYDTHQIVSLEDVHYFVDWFMSRMPDESIL